MSKKGSVPFFPLITDPADIPVDILELTDAVLDSIPLERTEKGMNAGQPSQSSRGQQ